MKISHSIKVLTVQAVACSALVWSLYSTYEHKEVDYRELHHQDLMQEIIRRESSSGKHLWGQDGEWGPAQFKEQTFNWMKKKAGMEQLEWFNYHDQITLLDWAIRNGYETHWTTFKKAEETVVMRRYKN